MGFCQSRVNCFIIKLRFIPALTVVMLDILNVCQHYVKQVRRSRAL